MDYKMTDEERQLHDSEERNVAERAAFLKNLTPADEGTRGAMEENLGRCVTDEELADELDSLTQDEAAELAETIEAERKKAIDELNKEARTRAQRLNYWQTYRKEN